MTSSQASGSPRGSRPKREASQGFWAQGVVGPIFPLTPIGSSNHSRPAFGRPGSCAFLSWRSGRTLVALASHETRAAHDSRRVHSYGLPPHRQAARLVVPNGVSRILRVDHHPSVRCTFPYVSHELVLHLFLEEWRHHCPRLLSCTISAVQIWPNFEVTSSGRFQPTCYTYLPG